MLDAICDSKFSSKNRNKMNNYENIKFYPFSYNPTFLEHEYDPDANYFQEVAEKYDCEYFFENEVKYEIAQINRLENISALHLNIRGLKCNVYKMCNFLSTSGIKFSIICVSETWCKNEEFKENSNLRLLNYKVIPLERKTKQRGGGIAIYINSELTYRIRNDLTTSDVDKESLTIEIQNEKAKNILITCCYKPPSGDTEALNNYLKCILTKANREGKKSFILGDFNVNCLNYYDDSTVRKFYDEIYKQGAIPLINRPTRVTKSSATLIDNIITNSIFESTLKKGIIKTDISDREMIRYISFNDTLFQS